MGFRRWRGESGTHEVLSQPPGKNITYGALQNTRFQAADRPKTQRRTLTARQEKGLRYLTQEQSITHWNGMSHGDLTPPKKHIT